MISKKESSQTLPIALISPGTFSRANSASDILHKQKIPISKLLQNNSHTHDKTNISIHKAPNKINQNPAIGKMELSNADKNILNTSNVLSSMKKTHKKNVATKRSALEQHLYEKAEELQQLKNIEQKVQFANYLYRLITIYKVILFLFNIFFFSAN
jgi:hypothetical protein